MLNQRQQEAAMHGEGPALVLAGAGSGKTRVIAHRISHLLSLGTPPTAIVAVTFTNKAAKELVHRIESLTGKTIVASTFHSLGAKILRKELPPFTIYDEGDREKAMKEALIGCNLQGDKTILKSSLEAISRAKNDLLFPEEVKQFNPELGRIYEAYQAVLKKASALDFDDLLLQTVDLLRSNEAILEKYRSLWSFFLIDEYQDTNRVQHKLIELLSFPKYNVFAVGDPDQSIYSWRGANIANIMQFEKDFPGACLFLLEQNYRSSSNILSAANSLIAHNSGRYEKELWSEIGSGEKISLRIYASERLEAMGVVGEIEHLVEKIPLEEMAIFYRTNFQSRSFEDALLRRRIPYRIIGGISFYERAEVKDVLAYLRVAVSSGDFVAFLRTINTPKRGLGSAAVEKILASDPTQAPFEICEAICNHQLGVELSSKQRASLQKYVDLILSLRAMDGVSVSIATMIDRVMRLSGYLDELREDGETYEERLSNLNELLAKADEWEKDLEDVEGGGRLVRFLQELALEPGAQKGEREGVQLMTLHSSKGLEFRVVFLVGMEEELLPHMNAKGEIASIEEERRLCYVGMTRAKELLYLSASRERFVFGGNRGMRPSRFLSEIRRDLLRVY